MISRELYEIMTGVPIAMMLLGCLVGGVRFLQLGLVQKKLVLLLLSALLAEALSYLLRKKGLSNYPVHHVYAVLEYGVLIQIYRHLFSKGIASRLLVWSVPAMLLFAIFNAVFLQAIDTPNTYVIIASGLIMISLSILSFYRMLDEMKHDRIEMSVTFWLSIGVLIYFASTLSMFFYLRWLTPLQHENIGTVFVLNVFFNSIHYICFNIALWMKPE